MILLYFEVAFMVLPILGLFFSSSTSAFLRSRFFKYSILSIVSYNVLCFLGYSIKGDTFDYIFLTIEYPLVLLIMIQLKRINRNIYTRILSVIGYVVFFLGAVIGTVGFLILILISDTYISDKQFEFVSNGKTYEVRRYSFGGATLPSTKYTFDTYRTYQYLPIETSIDTSVFFDDKTDLDVAGNLMFSVKKSTGRDSLIISSGAVIFKKEL